MSDFSKQTRLSNNRSDDESDNPNEYDDTQEKKRREDRLKKKKSKRRSDVDELDNDPDVVLVKKPRKKGEKPRRYQDEDFSVDEDYDDDDDMSDEWAE
ncbi:MAG: hypothetical protein ACPG7F_16100 [Aggregatilineales bacterium]